MATTKEQWDLAFDILSQFERNLINPNQFKWSFFVDNIGVSKQTFMRNEEFISEFNRVRSLVRKYRDENKSYSLEQSIRSKREQEIFDLNQKIQKLADERDRAREQLAYAVKVAFKHNIDPSLFMEQSPLRVSGQNKSSDIGNNSVVKRLRAVKNEQSGKS